MSKRIWLAAVTIAAMAAIGAMFALKEPPPPDASAEWTYVAEVRDRKFYIDPKTIERRDQNVRVWMLDDLSVPPTGLRIVILSYRSHYELECASRRGRQLYSSSFSGHMLTGKEWPTDHDDDVTEWTYHEPVSPLASVRLRACS